LESEEEEEESNLDFVDRRSQDIVLCSADYFLEIEGMTIPEKKRE